VIPEGWKTVKFSEVTNVALGKMLDQNKNKGNEHPYLGNQNVQWNRFELSEIKTMRFEDRELERYSIIGGDLVVCEGGQPGRCAIWQDAPIMYQKALLRVRPKPETISFFLKTTLEYLAETGELANHFTGSTIKHLPAERLNGIAFNLPPLEEQVKIAEVLTAWDDALETLGKLIAAKLELKRGLMQALLTGKKRFQEFEAQEWKTYKLVQLFSEKRDTKFLDLPLLSITREQGIISRNEVERKDTSNADKSKYLRISPGDIGYNTMRMWQGVSGLSSLEGIISPAYTVCTPTQLIRGEFAAFLFKSAFMIKVFEQHSQGLTSDTWNLKFDKFSKIQTSIPTSLEEQIRIAEVLTTLDTELEGLRGQLERVKTQKKGLMQQLLTGKVRVKVTG
jgi:type I restriction enzyme, S subunit